MRASSELAKRRKAMGFSQERLAEVIGVNRSTIVRWETKGQDWEPYARNTDRLASALKVRPDQLRTLFAGRPIEGAGTDGSEDGNEGLLGLALPGTDLALGGDLEPFEPEAILLLLHQLAAVDNNTGPATVLPMVTTQQERITRILTNPKMRTPETLAVTSRFAEFRAWLHHDLGQLDQAMRWTNTAVDLAEEAGNDQLVAYHYMRKSNIASDAGRSEMSLRFARRSRELAHLLSPKMRAVTLRQEAQAQALLGDASTCSALLDDAYELAAHDPTEGEIAVYCSTNYIEMESANAWLELDRPADAIPILESADDGWPREFRRDHGLCKVRLSLAYAAGERPTDAVAKAREGIDIAKISGSERAWHFLRRTTDRLDSIGATDEAETLRHELPLVA
jgi:transcriptional regulator with XRE-family HTH domain